MAGTIAKDESLRLKKMIYRATRGKALTYFQDLQNADLRDYTGSFRVDTKTVYLIIFQEGSNVREKLTKICDSFDGEKFEIPRGGDIHEINRRMLELGNRIEESGAGLSHS
jgi:V-type H+-transporting ATPase subunit a